MPNNLSRTNRCKLIQDVSEYIWDDIISFHTAGANASEIYYTKKLLSEILNHSRNLNYSIWAAEPGNEKKWGSDIDIYVERRTNDFELYAFQAKLLKLGNMYDDLNRSSLGTYQWEKLRDYQTDKGCHVNYLFYNGVRNFTYNGTNRCANSYSEKELGLSYVDIDTVERITLSKNAWDFSDFHTAYSHPLSEIVCCMGEYNPKVKIYTYQDIIETLNNYQKVEFQTDIESLISKASDSSEKNEEKIEDKESKRKADLVFVIRNTSSSY